MNDNNHLYMKRALDLASLGGRDVMPNPQVGCVIVFDNKVIGEGYHKVYGGPHAEVNAINSVVNKSLLKDSTLFVTLEPCSHFGKTPPCADLIISSGIKKVFVASNDPNPIVSGKGILRMKDAGIEVFQGVMDEENRKLNIRFFTFHEKKRPFIILKWAQSADGFLDKIRSTPEDPPQWITNEFCRTMVHQWRSREQAIMVGAKTVVLDNPKLDVRNWTGKNPVRIVLAGKTIFSPNSNILDGTVKTYIFTNSSKYPAASNAEVIFIPQFSAKTIAEKLFELNIQSVFIEGGKKTLELFLKEHLWDEARVFSGTAIFENGIISPNLGLKLPVLKYRIQNTTLNYFTNVDI